MTSQALCLHIDTAAGLRHLPWELLHDGDVFLCAIPRRPFTPARRVTPYFRDDAAADNRPLRVLFMASSPEKVEPVLKFEIEEARILEATRHQGLELVVEESGSLEGLKTGRERLSRRLLRRGSSHRACGHRGWRPRLLAGKRGWARRTSRMPTGSRTALGAVSPRLLFLSPAAEAAKVRPGAGCPRWRNPWWMPACPPFWAGPCRWATYPPPRPPPSSTAVLPTAKIWTKPLPAPAWRSRRPTPATGTCFASTATPRP